MEEDTLHSIPLTCFMSMPNKTTRNHGNYAKCTCVTIRQVSSIDPNLFRILKENPLCISENQTHMRH